MTRRGHDKNEELGMRSEELTATVKAMWNVECGKWN